MKISLFVHEDRTENLENRLDLIDSFCREP